jgi:hypothetical protein
MTGLGRRLVILRAVKSVALAAEPFPDGDVVVAVEA